MSYPEAIRFLYELQLFGANFGLENTRRLAALAGHPEDRLRFIHVAGTNGKGSTCAMLESIYRTAGLRVGLYTSPHLVSFAERIQVNREMIPETTLAVLVARMKELLERLGPENHPTFFEVVTVLALEYFSEQKCDLVIWETGLGGRLDATNIVTPEAAIITNVEFDHETWLGNTLEKIATEKAGIIKPGIPVISGVDCKEAQEIISKRADECQAPLRWVSVCDDSVAAAKKMNLPLLGEHQRRNAALAIAAVEILQPKFPVSKEALRRGLSIVDWAGRLQKVERPGGPRFLLDGAHNPAGARALRSALEKYFPGTALTLILGVLRDKDWKRISGILAPLAQRIIVSPVGNQRTASPADVRRACQEANPEAEITAVDNLKTALELAGSRGLVVVTGSLYFIGEVIERLKTGKTDLRSERELNEWTGRRISGGGTFNPSTDGAPP